MGDVARVDEEGYYYIMDRAVDMVASGGVNIYPAEIEEVLLRHPAVFDTAVIGIKDPPWGERLVAFVVRHPRSRVTAQELIGDVEAHLASSKRPREIVFLEEFPYFPSGRLLKPVLRETC